MANIVKMTTFTSNAENVTATSSDESVAGVKVYKLSDEDLARGQAMEAASALALSAYNTLAVVTDYHATHDYEDKTWLVIVTGNSLGTAEITVKAEKVTPYSEDKTASFSVTVTTGLVLQTRPTKTTYTKGESVDLSGMELIYYGEDGAETITEGYEYSPSTLDTVGTQTITISYEGYSVSFSVVVTES